MFILQMAGWLVFSCILMSFIEHQVHRKLMHRKNSLWLTTFWERTFGPTKAISHI